MITEKEFYKASELFNWIVPKANAYPILWNIGDSIDEYRVYQYQKNKKTIAIWIDVPFLSEVHFVRIYKKHKVLPHEFFLTQKNGKYRLGWRVK